jgi:hypothetical protein
MMVIIISGDPFVKTWQPSVMAVLATTLILWSSDSNS